jgi:KDO2-lipid IV(A) lauroyltransferase
VVRVTICVVQAVRIETCQRICGFLAWLSFEILKIRRAVIEDNLNHAFPEMSLIERDALGRRMWKHIFLLTCELAHVPRKIHDTNWRDYITFRNLEWQARYLLSPRPTVVVSGHFGNFEVGGVISALLGYPTFSIARTLDNPLLDRFIKGFREATGQVILPKKGSSFQIDQVLRAGGTLMLLGDQHAGPKGCWVEFFGRPASCHKAVALFSLTQRAPMAIGYAKRLDHPLRFELGIVDIYDPETDGQRDVQELSQWYSRHLENVIRTAPEQYWWLHRRWKKAGAKTRRRDQSLPRPGAPDPHQPADKPTVSDKQSVF